MAESFLLCDPGWYVHTPDVQNKWEENTYNCIDITSTIILLYC